MIQNIRNDLIYSAMQSINVNVDKQRKDKMMDNLNLKKFLVVTADGTRNVVEAVDEEFIEIRYEDIDEKIESIEEIKHRRISIVKDGSIVYHLEREYTNSEFQEVVDKILNNLRNTTFDKKSNTFICANKLTAELAYSLFASDTL